MHRLALTTLLTCLCAAQAGAQLIASRTNAVAVGHHHLNVTDIDAHKKFWADQLGGEVVKLGAINVIKLPNALIFLRKKEPTGGSRGTSVNHIGFQAPDVKALVAKLKSQGVPIITRGEVSGGRATGDVFYTASQDTFLAFVQGPDDIKVEIMENKRLTAIVNHHIHLFSPEDAAMRAWYVKHFNAKPGTRGPFLKADVPGIDLTFAVSNGPVVGTKGRVLDHIGFEIDNLEAFCKKLEAAGASLDVPFRKVPALGISIAFLTDPWGTYIELTEGLDKM